MNQFKGSLPILLVLVIFGSGFFFAYPQYTGLTDARAQLSAEEQRNEALKQSEAAIDAFLRQYRSLSTQQQQADKILPYKKTDIQNVLANLDAYATTSGVSVSSISFTDSNTALSAKPDYKVSFIELNMTVAGTYPSFKAFLLQLENTLRLMDITSINLQTGDQTSTALRYNVIARVYYQN